MTPRQSAWTGFRSVLCPIDFSEHSRLALRYAEAIAIRGHASLAIAYVNDPLLVAATAAALRRRDLVRRSAVELETFAGQTLKPASKKRLRLAFHVSVGDPGDEIVRLAARRRSDLIVLGTHGLTGTERLLVGSTTTNVLRHTTRPVLAVPLAHQPPDAAASPWPGEPIVAALDLGSDSERQVHVAAAVAEWFGSSLLLLHVVPGIPAPAWMKAELTAHERTRVAEAERQLDTLAAIARQRVRTDAQVVCGRASDEIAALAAAERIGLVITALREKRGWLDSRRGSVSYHVLTHAVTPVLAYPPRWRP